MDDLKEKRENTKEINIPYGLPENAPICISMDVRYNSTTLKTSYRIQHTVTFPIGGHVNVLYNYKKT